MDIMIATLFWEKKKKKVAIMMSIPQFVVKDWFASLLSEKILLYHRHKMVAFC